MRRLALLLALLAGPALADPPHAQGWGARVCAAIAEASAKTGLDPHFHARLLWQESRFRADAVSPAGAMGIAQFIRSTADREGLENPFDPWTAIPASSRHLADLLAEFGNLGLAASGYNAGPERTRAFTQGTRGLPRETRDYIAIITGLPHTAWREADPAPDLALGPVFRDACAAMARRAIPGGFRDVPAGLPPWRVLLAAGRTEAMARRIGGTRFKAHSRVLGGYEMVVAPAQMPGMGTRARPVAQVAVADRDEARRLCARIQAENGWCAVHRSR